MDSLCEETGLRRSAKACHSQVEVAAVPETKEEVVACPPADSETSGQDDPPTVQDVVSPAGTPKPGKVLVRPLVPGPVMVLISNKLKPKPNPIIMLYVCMYVYRAWI